MAGRNRAGPEAVEPGVRVTGRGAAVVVVALVALAATPGGPTDVAGAAATTGVRAGAGAPAAAPAPAPAPAGTFGWPLAGVDPSRPARPGAPGAVLRRFLPPPTPYGRGHRGADLAAPAGTPVLTAGPGTVAFAGMLAGRGVVSVRHAGGLRTTYEPVDATVAAGTVVARGTSLGTLAPGHRGCGAAACLHYLQFEKSDLFLYQKCRQMRDCKCVMSGTAALDSAAGPAPPEVLPNLLEPGCA